MTDLRKAAELALEALEEYCITRTITRPIASSDALRQALAQPESHTTLHDVCEEVLRLEKINAGLLEALKLAHATLCGANMNEKIVFKKITAAIAKATGEQA